MGSRIATRLLAAGHDLAVWNRSREKAEPLAAHGARVERSPADAGAGAELAITVLADGPTVTQVLFERGVADVLALGGLVVDMSSIPPETAREHASRLRERGIAYLDAPVSGGTQGAEQGTLAILVGGEQADFERARSVLTALGRPTHMGPVGTGQLAKLVNQVVVAVTVAAVAEGLLLAAEGGADPAVVREALFGGFADSRILREQGRRMVERSFAPGGLTRMQLKDLNTVLDTAAELGLELPVSSLVRDLFASLGEHGGLDLDHSALLAELERRNGLRRQLEP